MKGDVQEVFNKLMLDGDISLEELRNYCETEEDLMYIIEEWKKMKQNQPS